MDRKHCKDTEAKKCENYTRNDKCGKVIHQCTSNIIKQLPDPTFMIDCKGRVVAWNKGMENLTGIKADEIIGEGNYGYAKPFYGFPRPMLVDFVFMEDQLTQRWYKSFRKEADRIYARIFCSHLHSGKGAFLWGVAFPVYDGKGSIVGAVESIRDITDQVEKEKNLHENIFKFNMLFDNLNDGIFMFDLKNSGSPNCFFEVNDVACYNLSYEKQELYKMTLLDIQHQKYVSLVQQHLERLLENKHTSLKTLIKTKDGRKMPVELTMHLFNNGDRQIVLTIAREITELGSNAYDGLASTSSENTLSIPNKFLFNQIVADDIYRMKNTNNIFAVIMLHIDLFKNVVANLKTIEESSVIKDILRRINSISTNIGEVVRISEEKFAFVIQLAEIEDVIDYIKKINNIFNEPLIVSNRKVYFRPNMGISFYPRDGMEPHTLIKKAEIALYSSLEKGASDYTIYTTDLNRKVAQLIEMESMLREALDNEEFVIHYQPIVDFKTGKVVGAEALLRWAHPDMGLIYPDKFIPTAETTGLILSLGEWVMHEACRQGRIWHDMGLSFLDIAVNISMKQFQNAHLKTSVTKALKDTHFNPGKLQLEITESISMEDPYGNIKILEELRELGIKIVLDDFGTGYSSLSYLTLLSPDTLKIDKSFVRDLTSNKDNAAISRAIIQMAHQLGIKVIAEGVENVKQLKLLQKQKCDFVQGFLISKPMPPEAFVEFMTNNNKKLRLSI